MPPWKILISIFSTIFHYLMQKHFNFLFMPYIYFYYYYTIVILYRPYNLVIWVYAHVHLIIHTMMTKWWYWWHSRGNTLTHIPGQHLKSQQKSLAQSRILCMSPLQGGLDDCNLFEHKFKLHLSRPACKSHLTTDQTPGSTTYSCQPAKGTYRYQHIRHQGAPFIPVCKRHLHHHIRHEGAPFIPVTQSDCL